MVVFSDVVEGDEMIKFVPGMDIFDHPINVTLVNTVNTVGVMGAGLAKEFKRRYPELNRLYRAACQSGEFGIGYILDWRSVNGRRVLCFPTKKHWRNPSRLEYIELGLRELATMNLEAVALPMLGCGLGGLAWVDVRALMIEYLGDLPGTYYVHGEG